MAVHANQSDGALAPIWTYFGYDEPNYSYAPNGKKLLSELSALSRAPVYVRVHNLLTSGDGSSSLKWGSTNVYTEDSAGKPVYNWTILDQIFDAFHEAGIKPLVEVGFMPEALSSHPQPYRHTFPDGDIFTGWAYPPRDYQKWAELVFQFARHLRARYGDKEVNTWLWEVWNEPDIPYWKGTPEEYFKLYDFSAEAILRAFPAARIGGPDSTGPANAKAADFLRLFLEHCAHGKNYSSGKIGSRLDFISYHPKGSPKWEGNHVQMGIARQLASIEEGFKIVASFPQWRHTPIVLGESDPEGCAACSAKTNPQNSYRNGPLYAIYTTEVLDRIYELARDEQMNFLGSVTWAFEFEDQPPFAGFRELATNGIDKPVLNAFRMFGLLGSERVRATSSAALATEDVLARGVRHEPDVNLIAGRKDREIEALIWNYHDDDVSAPAADIDLIVDGLPAEVTRAMVEHLRIDSSHSNAFTAWQQMGSPQTLSASQYEQLQKEGQLQLLASPESAPIRKGSLRLHFSLPRQAMSLVRIAW
ncbi:MAG TPA: beta-xylosidase [Candidatus Sulfotelmatobacter sp.]|nr:beta-xylosidase [Candidatus Sulfotelmatobacter sp.]